MERGNFYVLLLVVLAAVMILLSHKAPKDDPKPTPSYTPVPSATDTRQADYIKSMMEPCRDEAGEYVPCKG